MSHLWHSQKAMDQNCSTAFYKIDGKEVEITLATVEKKIPDGYFDDAEYLGQGVWSRKGRPNTGAPERLLR